MTREGPSSGQRARDCSKSPRGLRTKTSRGWAPESGRPFTKTVGVPVTPSRTPSSKSRCTAGRWTPSVTQPSNRTRSRPAWAGYRFKSSGVACGGWANWHVVVFPELASLAGTVGCLRCTSRLRMRPIEREVPVRESHLAGVALKEPCQRWLHLPAERAGKSKNSTSATGASAGPRAAPRRPARRAGQSEVAGVGLRPRPATGARQ
jgi:hypothetical protein